MPAILKNVKRTVVFGKTVFVFTALILAFFFFTTCIEKTQKPGIINNHGEEFAGSASCQKCHADVYDNFIHTAHYTTSEPGLEKYIKGSFDKDSNVVNYNFYDRVYMHETDTGLYQSYFYKNDEKQSEKMDIVIGSGTRGQTYLYWKKNSLYQLPVSYFTPTHGWSNSPGNDERIVFNRVVFSRCMECHATYLKTINNSVEAFDKSKVIYGVSCESCHGAAERHVQFHTDSPQVKQAKYIVNPGLLTRQQQLDQCALCHSGTKENLQPSFSFRPGDTLSKFYVEKSKLDSAALVDVHGSKYNLLTQSKCFINSPKMTCITCHNTHNNERGNVALFSTKCMTCHNEANSNFCKMAPQLGSVIKQDCIDCHMPNVPSSVLSVYIPEKSQTIAATIRQHLIKVYPGETQKVSEYLKSLQHTN